VTREVIGDSPERRVEILCETDALHATWSRFAAGRDGADLHVHRGHNDLFYVLEGELTLRLGAGDTAVAAPAGTLALVPPLVVHGYRNAGGAEVRFLNVHAPGSGFAAYLRALRDGAPHTFDQHPPPPDGGRPASDAWVGRGEVVEDGDGGRVRRLADVAEIRVDEVALEPGAAAAVGPGESVYVLGGALSAGDDDGGDNGETALEPGSWLSVPTDVALRPAGAAAARFLRLRAPSPGVR
jgi:mannose-6-phosphate isomerase-like protein (cupin superfamily)